MAKEALVRLTDQEILGLVMQALGLSPQRIPVTYCGWHDVEQLDEAQLIIATPWYDSKGPRTAYSAVVEALQRAGVYEEIPMRRVFLKGPSDPLVRILEQEAKAAPDGFLHLLRHDDGKYSAVFAPLRGPGGSVPVKRLSSKDEAEDFLLNRLRLRRSAVEEAFLEVAHTGTIHDCHNCGAGASHSITKSRIENEQATDN